ncbi:hypothetical protein [Candidatus Laterigemmans baculatus]|uniref:hypothetical protein n=1 Tax=Candidatus Laterigemmans baculatus TaxID=2770505 RepID=UPI0013DD0992|nr:hypothetical protein [Candidatus Laterigemmans baculatus]
MLSEVQLATVRAALQFWREEMCPAGDEAADRYFDETIENHLSARQVQNLELRFEHAAVRYIPYNRSTERIAAPHLFSDRRLAQRLTWDGFAVGTVLLG